MELSNFGKTMNSATSIAQNVRSSLDKFHGIFSSDTTNSSIRDRYTNGFYGDTTQFRPSVFSRLFDEPTYLTFRIEFDFSGEKIENLATIGNNGEKWASLDYMPEPLLALGKDMQPANVANRQNPNNYSYYSTFDYLLNNVGDESRAWMLYKFINALKDIQENYPYYFTGVEGLNMLSMVRPEKGIRLDDDNNTITINCIEGLDFKITQLMQLYRKIAWDDVYQRWVLPDMMRFFNLKIYVSEIRLFHTMSRNSSNKSVGRLFDLDSNHLNATSYDQLNNGNSLFGIANNIVNTALGMSDSIFGPGSGASRLLNEVNTGVDSVSSLLGSLKGNMKLCDNAINDVMPTIVYDCKMCEFDISDTLEHISSLSSSKEGLSSPTPNIKIKVGKLKEEMYFPLQKGLKIKNNKKYSIEYAFSDEIYGMVLKDVDLENSGTKYEKSYSLEKFDDIIPTRKAVRVNKKFGEISNDDEAYDPFTADKKTSLTSLAGGVAGFFGTSHDSEAIEGDHVEEVRNLYATGEGIHLSEAATGDYSHLAGEKTTIQKSTAVTNGENKPNVKPSEVFNPSPADSSTGLIDENVGMYNSSAVVLGENKPNADKTKIHSSEAVTVGESKPKTEPEKLHESAATSQEREIQKIIDEEGEANVLSAATSIKKLIKYIEENDIIKSVATDDENNKEIMKSIVFENAIDTLSTATDKEAAAVKKLANMIKKEYLHESAATNMSFEKRQNIIQTFNYLNSNYGSE